MQEIRDMKTLGGLIRATRKAQKVNQTTLAQAANVGLRFVVELERGKPTVQMDKLLAVVNRLGIALYAEPPKGV